MYDRRDSLFPTSESCTGVLVSCLAGQKVCLPKCVFAQQPSEGQGLEHSVSAPGALT